MRLAALAPDGRAALWIGDSLVTLDAATRLGMGAFAAHLTPRDLLADEAALAAARTLHTTLAGLDETGLRELAGEGVVVPAAGAMLLPPVRPQLIVCAGNNYRKHSAEMQTALPSRPGGFLKTPTALNAPGGDIKLPGDAAAAATVDYEGELCVVFGKRAHRVSEGEALSFVAGYTIGNDVSARNDVAPMFAWLKNPGLAFEAFANPQDIVLLGKQYPTFFPLGPCITTADDLDPSALHITTRVNGEVRQDEDTSDLVFSVPQMIAYWSQYYVFEPGDVISTGSPSGVALSFTPPRFLTAGSYVEIEIRGIGVLANTVVA